jgi:hypothetical protein
VKIDQEMQRELQAHLADWVGNRHAGCLDWEACWFAGKQMRGVTQV